MCYTRCFTFSRVFSALLFLSHTSIIYTDSLKPCGWVYTTDQLVPPISRRSRLTLHWHTVYRSYQSVEQSNLHSFLCTHRDVYWLLRLILNLLHSFSCNMESNLTLVHHVIGYIVPWTWEGYLIMLLDLQQNIITMPLFCVCLV